MKSDKLCECGCNEYTEIALKTDSRRQQKKGEPMRFINGHSSSNGPARASVIITQQPAPSEINEARIKELRSMSKAEAAEIFTGRLRALESRYKRDYIERGFILYEVERRSLWECVVDGDTGQPYASFDQWVSGEAPQSHSYARQSLRHVKELLDVPREELMEVPQKNVSILAQLSSKVRKDPEVIKAAQTESKKGFIAHLQENHPDQKIEQETKITAHPTKSQAEVIDMAIRVIAWAYGVDGRESALEIMASLSLDADCEKDGWEGYTNRKAYEGAIQRGEITG